jgi:hypothetical protein
MPDTSREWWAAKAWNILLLQDALRREYGQRLEFASRRARGALMKNAVKWIFLILLVGLAVAQFFRMARTNPSFTATQTIDNIVNVPVDVHATLMRACGDCHSNETEWPWYSHVAPTSWFVVGHVNDGRRRINFSTWVRPGHEPQDSIDRLKAMCREVQSGRMPLTSYTLIHWSSKLSADDVKQICDWSTAEQKRLGGNVSGN